MGKKRFFIFLKLIFAFNPVKRFPANLIFGLLVKVSLYTYLTIKKQPQKIKVRNKKPENEKDYVCVLEIRPLWSEKEVADYF